MAKKFKTNREMYDYINNLLRDQGDKELEELRDFIINSPNTMATWMEMNSIERELAKMFQERVLVEYMFLMENDKII